MFHEALREVPISVIPLQKNSMDEVTDAEQIKSTIKENVLLGHFILDPFSTDFIGKYIIMFTDEQDIYDEFEFSNTQAAPDKG